MNESYKNSTYLNLLRNAQTAIEQLYNYQEKYNIDLQDKMLDTWGSITEEITEREKYK